MKQVKMPQPVLLTPTEEVLLKRRSVRLYRKDQVPKEMILRILEAGRYAPSAGNGQPWKFIVLQNKKIIDDITDTVVESCKRIRSILDYTRPGKWWLKPFAKAVIWGMPHELHPVPFRAISLIAEGKLGLWHGAPTVILIFKDVRGISNPDLDCGIAGQNMVLAAHSMGLGTCWVGFSQLAFRFPVRKWKKFFGIGYPYEFASSLAIGWPKGNPDGMVERTSHPVAWYEEGTKTTIL
ncbi:MAG: nitroreductase family protein [Nitrospirota bacterium]|jgi:nitroreductase|nr:nitroreductase family protein [Nitrospirota bacterium]